ncbi:hypothetical protein TG4357_02230 [Thalassovita gelatinovora]|uniref:Uncharacterized protein n=2 Tax=Thalassovita gelatinovora TaxID=53501 RepID=A0A0N7LVE7_THAGE|nr:hypothetical protein TG4357_02230 [Thalassovita gelatinovora]SEQ76735.1 hypothetical protein SAMN04488043_108179 [Thalassovita gelatinovora]
MWKPIAVLAAVGSVSAHLMVLANYSGPEGATSSSASAAPQPKAQASRNVAQTIRIGPDSGAEQGPAVKIAHETFFRFPEGTRIVSKTSTDSLMIIDLAIPMDREALLAEIEAAVNQTPYGKKMQQQEQHNSIKLEFWSNDGSGQIVLDEISDKKTSASIRIYGQDLFSRT